MAVVFHDHRYTYREVDEITDRLAGYILSKGLKAEDVVSILIPRSEWMPLAALGVLKAGCAYQPLDPSYPTERLNFMVKDAIGRKWQLGTIQVDYNLPERFQLEYTDADGAKKRPIMIHRAPFGSIERFTAVLLEHTAGHFPLWLAPDQVKVLPVSEKYADYAKKVCDLLNNSEIRASVDDRNETLGKRIREISLLRVPILVIVGEQEQTQGTLSMRKDGVNMGSKSVEEFVDWFKETVKAELS